MYYLFAYDIGYIEGGLNDLIGEFDSSEEAKALFIKAKYDVGHIVFEMKIIETLERTNG